jgi:hypothetical protein
MRSQVAISSSYQVGSKGKFLLLADFGQGRAKPGPILVQTKPAQTAGALPDSQLGVVLVLRRESNVKRRYLYL